MGIGGGLVRVGLLPKTVGITVLVVVSTAVALAHTATRQLEEKLTLQFESKGEAVALSLAFSLEEHASAMAAVREVQGLIDSGSTIDGVAYIYIQDHEGSILAHTFRPTFPPNFQESNWIEPGELVGKRRVKIAPTVTMDMADGRSIRAIDVAAPISDGRAGVVHVGMDHAEIDRPVAALREAMLLAGGAIAALGSTLGALFIGFWIVRPVKALHRVTSRVAETGELDQRVTVRGNDEIGDLLRSFVDMLGDLKRSRAQLDDANRNLSTRVQERTAEVELQKAQLESANRVLQVREQAQESYLAALRAFNEANDLDELLRNGLREVADCAGTLLGAVHLREESDGRLNTVVTQTVGADAVRSFEIGEGFAGRAAEERRLLTFSGISPEAWSLRFANVDLPPAELVCVPMLVRDRLVGVLELASIQPFDPSRLQILEALAGQFAVAIANMHGNARTRELAASFEQQNRTLLAQSDTLQRQQAELDSKNRALEKASRVKSEFLASMSHELRTPMNSIIGYTDLVLNRAKDLDTRMRRNLEKVLGNAQHLLGLINGILDLSKIEAGRMDFFYEEVDVEGVLESAASMSEVLFRNKDVKLHLHTEKDLPAIRTDKTKLRQVLLNLLSNAAKFTDKGEVRVRTARDGGRVRIEVEDTGVGIAPEDLPRVFEEFRQVGDVAARDSGTGLGLAIVKNIVEMMGGSIDVESRLGEGSRFTVRLPIAGTAEARAIQGAESGEGDGASSSGDTTHMRFAADGGTPDGSGSDGLPVVLVVDDEPDAVILVRETLAGHPYRVVGAFSGLEALRIARANPPFAILLDVMMPKLDGWDVLRELKATPDTAGIPVIMLSIVENRPLAFRLGASDYLSKPTDRDALLRSLRRLANGPVKRILAVDDDPQMRELLGEILRQEGYAVAYARDGAEALAALEREPPDLVVLDLMMPGVDGFEVVAKMRAREGWRDIPVLICTAKDLTAAEREMLSHFVRREIEKAGLNRDTLLAEVAAALGSIHSERRADAQLRS